MTSPKVEYNYLGQSGVRVSNLCLGTWTFGDGIHGFPTQASEEESHQMMDHFVELGGNFIDTANVYGIGGAERVVGNWLAKRNRDTVVLATKVRFPMNDDVNSGGLSRRHIVKSIEDSLERLQTTYVDLLQTHTWDFATPIDETLRTFDDLIRCGKIRYMGVSNVCGWQLQKIVDRIDVMGLNKCVTLQQQYSLLVRQAEVGEFPVCQNEGIGVLAWGALQGGLLTGKFKRGEKPDGTGSRIGFIHMDESKSFPGAPAWSKYQDDDGYWALLDKMKTIGDKYGKSIPQVALRWLLQRDVVASVIIGVTSLKQLDDNMGAASGWKMTDEEMSELCTASPRVDQYPYDLMYMYSRERNKFNRPHTCL